MLKIFQIFKRILFLQKVPEDYNLGKGILRTIHIGIFRVNPCCGLHLTYKICIENILILPSQTSIRHFNSELYFRYVLWLCYFDEKIKAIIKAIKILLCYNGFQIEERMIRLKEQIHYTCNKNNSRSKNKSFLKVIKFWIKYKSEEIHVCWRMNMSSWIFVASIWRVIC